MLYCYQVGLFRQVLQRDVHLDNWRHPYVAHCISQQAANTSKPPTPGPPQRGGHRPCPPAQVHQTSKPPHHSVQHALKCVCCCDSNRPPRNGHPVGIATNITTHTHPHQAPQHIWSTRPSTACNTSVPQVPLIRTTSQARYQNRITTPPGSAQNNSTPTYLQDTNRNPLPR